MLNSFGYVYLICDPANNMYKIGVTKNMTNNRLKKLQTGNPSELHIIKSYYCQYPFRLEKMLHNHFFNKRILNEWFELSNNDINNFENICNEKIHIIKTLSSNEFFMKDIH